MKLEACLTPPDWRKEVGLILLLGLNHYIPLVEEVLILVKDYLAVLGSLCSSA